MVVKEKIGRQRYILFIVNGIKKERLYDILKERKLKLSFYDGKYGIVKCKHIEKEETIDFLNKKGLKTIKTSGTIKKLKKLVSSSQS